MGLTDLLKRFNQALFALVEQTDVVGEMGMLGLEFLFNAGNVRGTSSPACFARCTIEEAG